MLKLQRFKLVSRSLSLFWGTSSEKIPLLVRIFEASSVFHLVSLQHIKVKSRAVYFLVALLASLQSYLAEDLSRTRCVYFYAAPAAFDLCNADGFCQLGLQFQKQSSVFLD